MKRLSNMGFNFTVIFDETTATMKTIVLTREYEVVCKLIRKQPKKGLRHIGYSCIAKICKTCDVSVIKIKRHWYLCTDTSKTAEQRLSTCVDTLLELHYQYKYKYKKEPGVK